MENVSVLNWGVGIILWLQQFSPTLDPLFKLFTFLGDEYFLLIFLPLIYWCVNRRYGTRLIFMFLIAGYVGAWAKVVVDQPRPFEYDPRVVALVEATGKGFPSLHTLNTVSLWGYLAFRLRRTWLWVLTGVLIVFVPLSRIYLGVHFPTDLLGGYVFGGALLLLYLAVESRLVNWLTAKPTWEWVVALVVPALMLIVLPSGNNEDSIAGAGMLLGAGVGFAIERRWVLFDSGGIWWKQAVRLLLGVICLFIIHAGLKKAFEGLEPMMLFRFIRYTLIGLWLGVGGPWVFTRLRLIEHRPPRMAQA
jgi:membrane-associated phospholipid phosphatase